MKKIVSILLTVILIASIIPTAFAYEMPYWNDYDVNGMITNPQPFPGYENIGGSESVYPEQNGEPKLLVGGNALSLPQGQDAAIVFTLTNTSFYPANNILCTISADASGIYPSALSNRVPVGTVMPGMTRSVTIPVTVSPDAAPGYASISLQFSFDNGMGTSFEQSESIGVTVTPSESAASRAKLGVSAANLTPSVIGSDQLTTLMLEIHNSGMQEAKNIEVSLEGYSASAFSLNDTSGKRQFENVYPGMNLFAMFPLKVSPSLEAGSHSMKVNLTYDDGFETVTVSEDVFFSFSRNPSAGVQVSSAKLNTSTPGASNRIKLTVGLKNKDTAAVTDVRTHLEGLSTGSFTLDGMFGSIDRDSLAAGAETTLEFPLYVSEALPTGNYPLTVVTKYVDVSGVEQTEETEIYLYINRPKQEEKPDENLPDSTPRVIISQYHVSTELIEAGKEFTLDFTLKNTSTTTAIKNLKIVLSSAEGIYLPVEGSSSFYEPRIEADGEATFTIRLVPKRDAETKTYPLTITIDYENEKNTSYNVTEALSFSVNQEQRLELNNISFMPNGMNPGTLSMQYINKGKAILYNMSVRVEGPFTSEYGVQYIGNFGIGSSDYYEDYITPTESGEVTGKLIVEYEDVNGKKTEMVEEFTAYIEEPFIMDDPGMMYPDDMYMDDMYMEEPAAGGGMWLWIGVAGGAVLLIGGIVLLIVIRRKRRKKAEMAIDE